jgi:hypothetical protein
MLAGMGAAAAGVAAGGTLAVSGAAGAATGPQDPGATNEPAVKPGLDQSFTQSLPNPKSLMLNTLSFVPISSNTYTYVTPGGLSSTNSQIWNCPIDLPAGSTIQGVSLYINPGGTARGFTVSRYNGAAPTVVNIGSGTSSTGNAPETVTAAFNHVVLGPPWAYRIAGLSLTSTAVLYGGVVNYLPAPEGFIALPAPVRVYDTRGVLPRLAPNEERIVSLAPHVPATAQGAVLNLTATQTLAAGYMAVFAADIPWPHNSSVNWTLTNQSIANLVITGIDNTSRIRVRGGDGSTHVVIDLLGYLTQ